MRLCKSTERGSHELRCHGHAVKMGLEISVRRNYIPMYLEVPFDAGDVWAHRAGRNSKRVMAPQAPPPPPFWAGFLRTAIRSRITVLVKSLISAQSSRSQPALIRSCWTRAVGHGAQ